MGKKKDSILKQTFRVANRGRLLYALSCTSAIFGMICGALPYLSVYFIARQILIPSEGGNTESVIMLWIAVAGISILLDMVFSYLGSLGCHITAFRLLYDFRIKVMEKIGSLPMGFLSKTTSGSIQKTMDENIEKIEGFIAHMFPDIIGSLIIVLGLTASVFALNAWIAAAVILSIAAGVFMQRLVFGGKNAKQLWVDVATSSHKVTGAFSEYVKGMAEVKLFGMTGTMTKGLEDNIESYKKWELKSYRRSAFPMSVYKTIILSVLTFVLPAGIVVVFINPEPQTFLAVLMGLIITPAIYDPLMTCVNYGTQMAMLSVGMDDINRILDENPIPEPRKPILPTEWNVEFDNVSFSYQDVSDPVRQMALSEVSFVAKQGKMLALVGQSGGGKSTIGQLLLRFWDIESGQISIGGVDIRDMPVDFLMDNVAAVFQDTYLFSDTVKGNITMNRSYAEENIIAAAKAACCHEFITDLPDGYDTKIGEGGADLSGGEAQRLSIARAILKNSPIVILDEAMAYSDAENENQIQRAIANLVKEKTVIVIVHRLQSIRRADLILVLKNGRIIERGTHSELISRESEYAELWNIQHQADKWSIDFDEKSEVAK